MGSNEVQFRIGIEEESNRMSAEIIAIGSELTSGAKLDTNSQWLSSRLAEHGILVHYHQTVADELSQLVKLLKQAADRSSLVIITGGLGPTLDDLTRQMMADMAEVPLELNEEAHHTLRQLFERRGIEMPERNKVQAMFPVGSEIVKNPIGTAPGIWMKSPHNQTTDIVALPGVPSEMKRMFNEEVLPKLPRGAKLIRNARVNCFGRGESRMEEMLGDLTARGRDPEVGITVHHATITLRINTTGETVEECEAKINETKTQIQNQLGHLVYGEEDEELEHIVVDLLIQKHKTVSTLELGTGGTLANRLHDYPASGECYEGGFVFPDIERARKGCGIVSSTVEQNEEEFTQLARSAWEIMGTDYLMAVSAWDLEEGDSKIPEVTVVLVRAEGADARQLTLGGDPGIYKNRVSKSVLNLLRLHLIEAI